MDKADPFLGYVSDLVDFVNLKPEDVEEFSRRNFLPKAVWGTRPASHTIVLSPNAPPKQIPGYQLWQTHQKKVQDLWKEGFPFERCLELVVQIDRFSQQAQAWEQVLQMSGEELQKRIDERTLFPPKPETWPIQKAIWFLSVNRWRVQFCKICSQPFAIIAPHTRKQGCCSIPCRNEADTRRKHRWGKKNNWGRN